MHRGYSRFVARCALALFLLGSAMALASCGSTPPNAGVFRLLASSENRDLEPLLAAFAQREGIPLTIEYAGTQDMVRRLDAPGADADACWMANSFWMYMLTAAQVKNAKPISINPIVFGVRRSKAEALGLLGERLSLADIVDAVERAQLSFLMPSPTQTNAGASAYIGFLSSLCGNPEVLTAEQLARPDLQEKLKTLFSGVVRSSGDDESIGAFFEGRDEYDALVDYESSLLALNERLEAAGREPVVLLYPYDGVSLADSPLGYIDRGDERKAEWFQRIQSFLLSGDTQDALMRTGRRANYGGLIPPGYEDVFRADWGVRPDAYLSPITVPASDVIREAFALYQEALRKPSLVVFCLDFSGSMTGAGHRELSEAMAYLLDPDRSAADLLQFTERDIIVMIPFTDEPGDVVVANGGDQASLLAQYGEWQPGGGTDIYTASDAAMQAIERVAAQTKEHTRSVVLMTDGKSQTALRRAFFDRYAASARDVPIYSITFGSADPGQLEELAKLTNGKVFDGTKDLVAAFRAVRGFQ